MKNDNFLIGSHVSLKSPNMFLGSAMEAKDLNENVFMVYTGAPQNTIRKPIDQLKADQGKTFMDNNHMYQVVVHAPYIVNLGNTFKLDNFSFAIEFLHQEILRAEAIGATQIVLHPGSHVKAGPKKAIQQIADGLNTIIERNQKIQIALETMSGKGTEVGRDFEELAAIIDKVKYNEKLSITMDTCHLNDAGYDVKNDFDGVLNEFDHVIGLEKLKVIHLNDSKNALGSHKDRHEMIGYGTIGFESLNYIAHHNQLTELPKILETPYYKADDGKKYNPHGYEVEMLKQQQFNPNIIDEMIENNN